MDPTEGWYWRTYMDCGEYGFGIFLSPLAPGVDCPAYATFLPAVVHADDGSPAEIPNAVCIFERNVGDPAWRHYEVFAQTPEAPLPAEGRPATELVVRSASEVGNYDYLLDYVFQQNGMIRVMVGATGLDAVKGVASKSMHDPTAAEDTRFGTLIAPEPRRPEPRPLLQLPPRLRRRRPGQHRSSAPPWCPETAPEGSSAADFWETRDEVPMTELEGRYRVEPDDARHVPRDEHERGDRPRPPSRLHDPAGEQRRLLARSTWPTTRRRSATPTSSTPSGTRPTTPDERYAGGEYAFQSDGSDSLPAWVQQDRGIHDTDIVTWYTMGFHHVPHMEDWPVMSTTWKGITLMPFKFFDHNPAMTIRTP